MKKLPGFTQDYLLSKATTLPDKTRLERAVEPLCARHPGECGILALDNSLDAFAAR
ncbi:phospholipase D family protein, partial [Salmonella enterica subsp. enterica serovar Montevideo]|nr:phospholipase D family protein [Salmonella enterica subsp. enterica serovar Montevideo]